MYDSDELIDQIRVLEKQLETLQEEYDDLKEEVDECYIHRDYTNDHGYIHEDDLGYHGYVATDDIDPSDYGWVEESEVEDLVEYAGDLVRMISDFTDGCTCEECYSEIIEDLESTVSNVKYYLSRL